MNEIRIDQCIGYDPWWDEGISAQSIRDQLAQMNGEEVTVWINSPGGDVLEGSAIYTALKEYKGTVTVKVEALAGSVASVIAMAADRLLMSPTSYLMVHRASTIAQGNVGDMDEAARKLRAIDQGIVEAYRLKTGMSRARILKLMEEETWINAKAALEMGFCDGILYAETVAPDEGAQEDGEDAEQVTIKAVASVKPVLYSGFNQKALHGAKKPDHAKADEQETETAEETEEETEDCLTAADAEEKAVDEKPCEEDKPKSEEPEEEPDEDEEEEGEQDEPEEDPDEDEPDEEARQALIEAKAALMQLLDGLDN